MIKLLSCALLIMIFSSPSANAWDKNLVSRATLPSDFAPSNLSAPDATGYWAAGYANLAPVLARYGNDGMLKLVRYEAANYLSQDDLQFYDASFQTLAMAAYPDGGLVKVDLLNLDFLGASSCNMRRYDASGNLLWVVSANDCYGFSATHQGSLQIDGSGNIWNYSGGNSAIDVIAPDGVRIANLAFDITVTQVIVDPHSSSAYASGFVTAQSSDSAESDPLASIEKVSLSGKVWSVNAPASDSDSSLSDIVIGRDGNIYGYGQHESKTTATNSLYGLSATADGVLRWSQSFTTNATPDEVHAVALDNAATGILYWSPNGFEKHDANAGPVLVEVSATGALVWQKSTEFAITSGGATTASVALRAATNGDLLTALDYSDDGKPDLSYHLLQARFDSTGNSLFSAVSAPLTATAAFAAQVLPDQTSLVVNGTFIRLDRSGSLLTPLMTAHVAGTSLNTDEAIASDGSAYLLSINASTKSYAVTAYSSDGALRWQTVLTSAWTRGGLDAEVVVRDVEVCVAGYLDGAQVAQCYARDTGVAAPQIELGASNDFGSQSVALADGQLAVVYVHSDGYVHQALLSSSDQIVHDVLLTPNADSEGLNAVRSYVNVDGSTVIKTATAGLIKFNLDGTQVYSITPDITQYTVVPADNGSTLLSQTTPVALIERIDANGKLVWRSTPGVAFPSTFPSIVPGTLRVSSSDLYLYLYDRASHLEDGSAPGYVVKLALSDGSVQWSKAASYPLAGTVIASSPCLALDTSAQHLLILTSYRNRIEIEQLNTADGSEIAHSTQGFGVDQFVVYQASIRSDGELRIISNSSDAVSGSVWQIVTLSHPFDSLAPIRVDQPGISGAWYAPYSTGQGFVLDFSAPSKTVFMPWFTFDGSGANNPSAIAWYTFQGIADTGATHVDMSIAAPAPGLFNSGTTQIHSVGSAQLTLTDCDHANLSYQFDASTNQARSGWISLVRLSPATSPCMLADGSTRPATLAATAGQGFDVRQSGSWYDPKTTGQGVELTVLPPGNGSNGFVFAAWFTFDPAGSGNDPLDQQWFTLQGDLSSAINGKVTLPILQTIGGTLDGLATRNTTQVGSAILTLTACDRATVDYQFSSSAVAHAFAGLQGSLNLSKIDGCSPAP